MENSSIKFSEQYRAFSLTPGRPSPGAPFGAHPTCQALFVTGVDGRGHQQPLLSCGTAHSPDHKPCTLCDMCGCG